MKLSSAINWKGEYEYESDTKINWRPSDDEFKLFYKSNFYSPNTDLAESDFSSNVSIPILDDPIRQDEVQTQIKELKSDKACGPDGIPPGVFKIMPVQWITFLVSIFNSIFMQGIYPTEWLKAKLVTLYKRGDRKDAKNYRGITLMNSIAKLYDLVLYLRLKQWFRPHREQAGSQKNRGCIEHIVTLRLLCDMAKKKKLKLFVTFIDFSQAYDRVPRSVRYLEF